MSLGLRPGKAQASERYRVVPVDKKWALSERSCGPT